MCTAVRHHVLPRILYVRIPTVHSVCPRPPSLDIQLFKNAPRWTAYFQEHLKTITYAKIGGQTECTGNFENSQCQHYLVLWTKKVYLLSMWLCFSQKNETRWLFSQINRVSRWAAAQVVRWACGCTDEWVATQVDGGLVANWTGTQLRRGGGGGWVHMWHLISYDQQQSSLSV